LPSGSYVVEGRVKDLINRGGEKISAEEVENLILAHPAVLDVACVPYPDPVLGERMCACLVLRDGRSLSLDELARFLLGFEIAKFKLPERVAFFDTLPLSGFGKVSKKELAATLCEPKGAGPACTALVPPNPPQARRRSDEGRQASWGARRRAKDRKSEKN